MYSKPPTKKYVHKRYQTICLLCPVSFQAKEVVLIPPQTHCHISEYQELISRGLQKICYHHISTHLRPSNNQPTMPDQIIYSCQLDSDVPKKNINTSQFSRKLKPVLKRPELKPKSRKTLQQMQISRLKKQSLILKKPHLRQKKPQLLLKKLNILLKKQRTLKKLQLNSNLKLNRLRP